MGACAHFLFLVPRSNARQVAEKNCAVQQGHNTKLRQLPTCNITFSSIARQAAERNAQREPEVFRKKKLLIQPCAKTLLKVKEVIIVP